MEESTLKELINSGVSYLEIGRMFNISNTTVKRSAIRMGIELPDRGKNNPHNKGKSKVLKCIRCDSIIKKSGLVYCSSNCASIHRSEVVYEKFINGDPSMQRADYVLPKTVKNKISLSQNNKCNICQIDNIWNNKKLVFILDHVDGDASNNKRDNLRCICSNCDSQLETYKNKNKNSARKERYLKSRK
jgi:hypothetical protein